MMAVAIGLSSSSSTSFSGSSAVLGLLGCTRFDGYPFALRTFLRCPISFFDRSAMAEHAWKDGHVIEWNEVEVLDTATDERQRRVKEALYIRMAPPGVRMNRDEGREVSPLWLNAIRKLRRTQGDQKTI